jgi:putative transposase
MPRQSRIDAPGALHHIIIRGIERRVIFRNNSDRDAFLDRFGELLLGSSTSCYAWALLSNHAHFLLRTGNIPIAGIMRRLLTGYAVTFNHRYRRHGHLFQNRYKSILCEEDLYLQELVRYIHLNPLRAGLVKDLKELGSFAYSGHSVLLGKRKRDWQDRGYVLGYFGQTEREAKREYLSFVRKGIDEGRKPELVGGGLLRSAGGWKGLKEARESGERVKSDERILGRSEFVERVLREAGEQWERRSRLRGRGGDLRWLIEKVAPSFGVETEDLKSGSRSRKVGKARAALCYMAVRELGLTCAFLAKELRISPSAVSKSTMRGRRELNNAVIQAMLESPQVTDVPLPRQVGVIGLDGIMAELYSEGRKATEETAEEIIDRLEARKNYIPSSDLPRREYSYVLLREYRNYIKDRSGSGR